MSGNKNANESKGCCLPIQTDTFRVHGSKGRTGTTGPVATVVITTKNRRDDLRNALRSVMVQSCSVEALVIDDGSTDGTADLVRNEFPTVRLVQSEISRGYIVQRNVAAKLATTPFLFSIDDDATFSTPDVVAQTLAEFDSDRIGAVAIPYIEPKRGNRTMQMAPSRGDVWVVDTFVGTAHAVRRDLFLKLGGYRENLVHQGEESDFCIRMLNAGWVVRTGTADMICHFESPKRDFRRMDFHGPRNSVLFAWQNVPGSFLPVHFAVTTVRCLIHTYRPDRMAIRLRGILDGYRACCYAERQPVSASIYRLSRRLKKAGPLRLSDIESMLGNFERGPVDVSQ